MHNLQGQEPTNQSHPEKFGHLGEHNPARGEITARWYTIDGAVRAVELAIRNTMPDIFAQSEVPVAPSKTQAAFDQIVAQNFPDYQPPADQREAFAQQFNLGNSIEREEIDA